ncbi:uncharacterized protein LOC110055410 [Orbicella faveolata]|uniref:uncharacterized protein LOC110055410 n=1 Tax=Orbicella faveolata TaxID=48498 RepID=UPI0009E1D6F2|nr:uncharacterized protein LOC110055410 [Orbicella faveolata]
MRTILMHNWWVDIFFPFSCDKHSNCLPGNSKKIKNCTIFSGLVCDGCEDGNYFDPLVEGCIKCSPSCSILQEEIRSCTTDHDRECKTKRTVTSPDLGNSPTSPETEIPPTGHGGKVPALAAEGTPHTSPPIPVVKDVRFWGGVFGGITGILVIVAIVAAIICRKSSIQKRLDAKQGQPLMSSAKPGEF